MSALTDKSVRKDVVVRHSGSKNGVPWEKLSIIWKVDAHGRYFYLRSLATMEDDQMRYHFNPDSDRSATRKTMEIVSYAEAATYLTNRRDELEKGTMERQHYEERMKLLPRELQECLKAVA